MLLSMWMIADWFKDYNPFVSIIDGGLNIRGARLMLRQNKPNSQYVYISKCAIGVICVNNGDYVIVDVTNTEGIFNEIMNIFDYYQDWENKINDRIENKCSLQEIIDITTPVINRGMIITDSGHMVQAMSDMSYFKSWPDEYRDYVFKYKTMPLEQVSNYNKELDHMFTEVQPYYYYDKDLNSRVVIHNILIKGQHRGWLLLGPLESEGEEWVKQFSKTINKKIKLWFNKNGLQKMLLAQAEIFKNVLEDENIDKFEMRERLNRIGWFEDDKKYLLNIDAGHGNTYIYYALVRNMSKEYSGCYTFEYGNSLVVVVNERLCLLKELKSVEHILKKFNGNCGISYPFNDLFDIKQCYKQADMSLQYGKKENKIISYCEEYAIAYARNVLKDNITVNISHHVINEIKKYDDKNKTEYAKTLKLYLINERNQSKTAKELKVHKNTLIYRMNRLEEMFDMDLDNTELRLHLLLSFMLE